MLKTFVQAEQHLSAEELYARVEEKHPGIGYATIYRTLKLLAVTGFDEERQSHKLEHYGLCVACTVVRKQQGTEVGNSHKE